MNTREMIEKLKLTDAQQKAFNRMKRALKDFENLGGKLVGNNETQYAMNGCNVVGCEDWYESKLNEELAIRIDSAELDSIFINDPFNDSAPWVIVRGGTNDH